MSDLTPGQPVPLTWEIRQDFWRFMGDWRPFDMLNNYPELPPQVLKHPPGQPPELVDSPFTRAFIEWRSRGCRSK